MKIEITGDTLLIDGKSAGSLTDARVNFPALSAELWVSMTLRCARMDELERDSSTQATLIAQLQAQVISDKAAHDAIVANLQGHQVTPPLSSRVISPAAFREKFTEVQLMQVATRALTDPNMAVLLLRLYTSQSVDLDAPETTEGLRYLVTVGVLADLSGF